MAIEDVLPNRLSRAAGRTAGGVCGDAAGRRDDLIADYLARLDDALRGPAGVKADLLQEAHDSLQDAVLACEQGGLPAEEAERRAVAEFGDLVEVAAGYQTELAYAQAGRTAGLLLIGAPLLTFLWDLAWWASPWRGSQATPTAVVLARITDVLSILSMLAGGFTLVGLRRALRRAQAPRRVVRRLGIVALAATSALLVVSLIFVLVDPRESGRTVTGWPPIGGLWLVSLAALGAMIRGSWRWIVVAAADSGASRPAPSEPRPVRRAPGSAREYRRSQR